MANKTMGNMILSYFSLSFFACRPKTLFNIKVDLRKEIKTNGICKFYDISEGRSGEKGR
jgi:hypothetical protein